MGVVEHKVMKNDGGANLSPGVEDLSSEATTGDAGLLLVEYRPFGVINSITPDHGSDIDCHQSCNHHALSWKFGCIQSTPECTEMHTGER